MRSLWRRIQRIELGLELVIAGAILELFDWGIRPFVDVGCGSAPSQASDDLLVFVTEHRLTMIVPAVVMLIETQVAFRPWVKRVVRLGAGLMIALMLFSYGILARSFIR